MTRKDDQQHRPVKVWWLFRAQRCKCGHRWVNGKCTKPRTRWGDLPAAAVPVVPDELTTVITVRDLTVKDWQQEGT